MLIHAVRGLGDPLRQETEDAAHEAERVRGGVGHLCFRLLRHVLRVGVLVSVLRAGGLGGVAVVDHVRVLPALPVVEFGQVGEAERG